MDSLDLKWIMLMSIMRGANKIIIPNAELFVKARFLAAKLF